MQRTLERISSPGGFVFDPSLVLYLPLYELDGASIMSRDAYGHLCTVTGALWRLQGRWFDGSDDKVDGGSPPALKMGSKDFSFGCWFNSSQSGTPGEWRGIICVGGGTAGGKRYMLTIPPTATVSDKVEFQMDDDVAIVQTRATVTDWDSWHLFFAVRDGDTARTYIDGLAGGTQDCSGTGSLDSPNNRGLCVGGAFKETDGSFISAYLNLIGEVFIYSRALNPLENQNIYLATKWRYR